MIANDNDFQIVHSCGGVVDVRGSGAEPPPTPMLRDMDVEILTCTECGARAERVWALVTIPGELTRDGRMVPPRRAWHRKLVA